jgi:hypothetical protein
MHNFMLDQVWPLLASNMVCFSRLRVENSTLVSKDAMCKRPHALVKGRVFCRKYLTFMASRATSRVATLPKGSGNLEGCGPICETKH